MTNRNLFYLPVIVLSGFLFGCSPTGVPLAGDQVLQSLCPESGCADATPDQNQLSLRGPGVTNIQSKVAYPGGGSDFIEFGGDCYPSTYPNNRIEVSVNGPGGAVTLNVGSDVIAITGGADTTPRCFQGRYGIGISGAKLPPSGSTAVSYTVKLEIVGYDADGNPHRNANTGSFTVSVLRYP